MREDEEGLLLLGGGGLVWIEEDCDGKRRKNMRDVHG